MRVDRALGCGSFPVGVFGSSGGNDDLPIHVLICAVSIIEIVCEAFNVCIEPVVWARCYHIKCVPLNGLALVPETFNAHNEILNLGAHVVDIIEKRRYFHFLKLWSQ